MGSFLFVMHVSDIFYFVIITPSIMKLLTYITGGNFMITLIAMIIYVFQLNKEDEIKFLEECNRSKYLIGFVGLMGLFEVTIEVILTILKLIFKKR